MAIFRSAQGGGGFARAGVAAHNAVPSCVDTQRGAQETRAVITFDAAVPLCINAQAGDRSPRFGIAGDVTVVVFVYIDLDGALPGCIITAEAATSFEGAQAHSRGAGSAAATDITIAI